MASGISPDLFNTFSLGNQMLGLPQLLPGLMAAPAPVAAPKAPKAATAGKKIAAPLGATRTTAGPSGAFVKGRPWINAVLKQLGAPATPENVKFLQAWGEAEGGGGYGSTGEGQYNWLNTMRGAGANWNQPNFQTGVRNTVGALTNGYYDNIVTALKSGKANAQQMGQMVANSKWGTHEGVLNVLRAGPVPVTLQVDHSQQISPKAGSILQLARQYLGTPYHFGGASPQTGFDCSGFIQWLYAQKGIALPRTTFQQVASGRAVANNIRSLKPGDILFFNTENDPRGPSHEALYIGAGQFIQAPHTGDVVKISSLRDKYYATRWVATRRIL